MSERPELPKVDVNIRQEGEIVEIIVFVPDEVEVIVKTLRWADVNIGSFSDGI